MALYAIVQDGKVASLVSPPDGVALTSLSYLTSAQIASAVAVPAGTMPRAGWSYANGVFTPPGGPAPALTLAQQASAMLTKGLPISSASTPALNGTYAADPETRSDMQAEAISLILNGNFTNGTTSLAWPDASGTLHTFTAAQFKSFATAIGATVGALKQIILTGSGTLPTTPIAIP